MIDLSSDKPKPGAAGTLPVCETCGSNQVMRDAWAIWNQQSGAWELGRMFDATDCDGCGGQTSLVWITNDEHRRRMIRHLNDALRRGQPGLHDRVVVTAGIAASDPDFVQRVRTTVATFDVFDADNDPFGQHDFGAFTLATQRVFFKVDYYNLALSGHSPDPSDPAITARVLTIMFASEY